MIIITGPRLKAISAMAAANSTTIARNTRLDPYAWPILAPSMMKPATMSEYVTIAVPMTVAGALKVETILSMDTCREETLEIIRIWAMPMTTIGNHDAACGSASA